MKRLIFAMQTLTILPVRTYEKIFPVDYATSGVWYFLPSLLVGGVMLGVYYLFYLTGIALLAAFMSVFAACVFTGGLHVDGFADTCEAFFARRPRQQTLDIMRDSRLGTYGVLSVIFIIGIKTLLITYADSFMLPLLFLAAPVCGKIPLLMCAGLGRYARPDGQGRHFVAGMTTGRALLAILYCAIITTILGLALPGFTAAAMGVAAGVLMYIVSDKKIGGVTGDVLGACNEIGEVIFWLSALVLL